MKDVLWLHERLLYNIYLTAARCVAAGKFLNGGQAGTTPNLQVREQGLTCSHMLSTRDHLQQTHQSLPANAHSNSVTLSGTGKALPGSSAGSHSLAEFLLRNFLCMNG